MAGSSSRAVGLEDGAGSGSFGLAAGSDGAGLTAGASSFASWSRARSTYRPERCLAMKSSQALLVPTRSAFWYSRRASASGSAGGVGAGGRFSGSTAGVEEGRAAVTNEKSSTSEEENHGTCSPWEARDTPTIVRLNTSSILPGARISLSNSLTKNCRSPSLTTMLGAAAYITAVPLGAATGARPAATLRKRRSNGFLREASRMAILTRAPLLLISARTESRLYPSRRTSASVQIWALTGTI